MRQALGPRGPVTGSRAALHARVVLRLAALLERRRAGHHFVRLGLQIVTRAFRALLKGACVCCLGAASGLKRSGAQAAGEQRPEQLGAPERNYGGAAASLSFRR